MQNRGKKWWLIPAGIIVVLFLLVLLLPHVIDLNRYAPLITEQIQAAIGGKAHVGSIRWGIVGNGDPSDVYVEIEDFSLQETVSPPIEARLSKAYIEIAILPLVFKRLVVERLVLGSPAAYIQLTPLSPAKVPPETEAAVRGVELPLDVSIKKAAISNGRVSIDDSVTTKGHRIVRNFSDINIDVTGLKPGQPFHFNADMRDATSPGFGTLSIKGSFKGITTSLTIENPELDVSVNLAGLDVDAVKPYLQNAHLDQHLSGQLSATAEISGEIGKTLNAAGALELSKLVYRLPTAFDTELPNADTRIVFQLHQDAQRITIDELNLFVGELDVKSAAVVDNWRTRPVISGLRVASEIPLKSASSLLPWKKINDTEGKLKALLNRGGQVSIESVDIPDFDPVTLPDNYKDLLAAVTMTARVAGISGSISPLLPDLNIPGGTFRLEDRVIKADEVMVEMGPLSLPSLSIQASDILDDPKVSVQLEGSVESLHAAKGKVQDLLTNAGLSDLTGKMAIALNASYDHTLPEKWLADGFVRMSNIRAVSYPEGVVLNDLSGNVVFKRQPGVHLEFDEVSGRVDDAAFRLHGTISKDGPHSLAVDAGANIRDLDLSKLEKLYPAFEKLKINGRLSADFDFKYDEAHPEEKELRGHLDGVALGFQWPEKELTFSNGELGVALETGAIDVTKLNFLLNDQPLKLNGSITEPKNPKTIVHIASDGLNIGRLLTPAKKLIADADIIEKMDGQATVDLTLAMPIRATKDFTLNGRLGLRDTSGRTALNPASIEKLSAVIHFSTRNLSLSDVTANVILPAPDESTDGRFSIAFQGQIDEWRRKPVLQVERFGTSVIPLASLGAAIPWEKLDAGSEKIRDLMTGDGGIAIKNVTISTLDLSAAVKQPLYALSKVNGAIELVNVAVKPIPSFYTFEGINGLVGIKNQVLIAKDIRLRMGPVTLPKLNVQVSELSDNPTVSASLEGTVQLGAVTTPQLKEVMKSRGLERIGGELRVGLQVNYDHANPKGWTAAGDVRMNRIEADSYPQGVTLTDLNGRMSFRRKDAFELLVDQIQGKINETPMLLHGNVTTDAQGEFEVDGTVQIERLDLSHLAALNAELKKSGLRGILNVDIQTSYSSKAPRNAQLNGKLATTAFGLHLPEKNLSIKNGDADIGLTGKGINVDTLDFEVNDQIFSIEGSLDNPEKPHLQLSMRTDDIDLNRLLGASDENSAVKEADAKRDPEIDSTDEELKKEQSSPSAWHRLVGRMTAEITIQAEKGRYKEESFEQLACSIDYTRGLFEKIEAGIQYGGGSARVDGKMDFRDPERLAFEIKPDIQDVRMESIGALFSDFETSVIGPISINGHLSGNTGDEGGVVPALNGHIDARLSRGRFTSIGPVGRAFTTVFSVVNLQGLLSGRVLTDMGSGGLPFNAIEASAGFGDGIMTIDGIRYDSDSLDVNLRGTMDMVDAELDLRVELIPFGTVSGILNMVPLVGRAAAGLTMIHTDVRGPLDNPQVFIRPDRMVTHGFQ